MHFNRKRSLEETSRPPAGQHLANRFRRIEAEYKQEQENLNKDVKLCLSEIDKQSLAGEDDCICQAKYSNSDSTLDESMKKLGFNSRLRYRALGIIIDLSTPPSSSK